MKKITITIILVAFTIASKAQLQKTIFVGLNTQPLYISGGLELTAKIKKVGLFVRPTYNRREYDRHTEQISYIDIPFGLKFLIIDEPSRGSAVPYSIDFSAGPFVGYAMKGKYFPSSGATQKDMVFGSGANAQLDKTDYGYFLNTQLNMGLIGFGISAQVGLQQHDMSKLGFLATPTKQKSGTQLQICMNINLGGKKKE
jgi:Outer membrane protein beta-barrel domain